MMKTKAFHIVRTVQFLFLTTYATYLSLTPNPGDVFASVWDKFLHVICWLGLCLSLRIAVTQTRYFPAAALGLFAYSILIEIVQHTLPPREFSVADIVANAVGIISGLAVAATYTFFLSLFYGNTIGKKQ
jgi:VanZ family protein